MALQSSGAIKISEIKAELGSSSNSLRTLSAAAGFSTPDAMSEFYGYSSAPVNTHYYTNDGVNDYIKGAWENYTSLHNTDWSISFWVKQNSSTKVSQQLWDFNANSTLNSGNTTNRVFLQYVGSSNRLMLRVRTNSVNFDRQISLHDNLSTTGVSSAGWTASNRGNVNAAGYCLITVTYDASATTGASAIKIYWNGTELTGTAASSNGARSAATFGSLSLCAAQHSITGGNFNGSIDEWAFYSDILTSSEVTTLYNSGSIVTPENLHTNNLQEVVSFGASNALSTYSGLYGGTINGGSTNTY